MSIFLPKLCLGTAQFGSNYGITNVNGKLPFDSVRSVLNLASKFGINYLDTAKAYGDAQETIGKCLTEKINFKIISKFKEENIRDFSLIDEENWDKELENILSSLSLRSIDSLLLHSPSCLTNKNVNILYNWFSKIKKDGLVSYVGLSIYDGIDIKNVDLSVFDIVQIPFSLYNQNLLLDGTIEKLLSSNCTIHVRSIFLQGLLLLKSSKWPNWIKKDFLSKHLMLEDLCAKRKISLLDLSLSFIKSLSFVDTVIFGISSSSELNQFMNSWSQIYSESPSDYTIWNIDDIEFVDPRFWPR